MNGIDLIILASMMPPDVVGELPAYLDPGTGSFLIQLLIGLLAATAIFIRGYWHRIRNFFLRMAGKAPIPLAEDELDEEESGEQIAMSQEKSTSVENQTDSREESMPAGIKTADHSTEEISSSP